MLRGKVQPDYDGLNSSTGTWNSIKHPTGGADIARIRTGTTVSGAGTSTVGIVLDSSSMVEHVSVIAITGTNVGTVNFPADGVWGKPMK